MTVGLFTVGGKRLDFYLLSVVKDWILLSVGGGSTCVIAPIWECSD